jgi:hypothetical protein
MLRAAIVFALLIPLHGYAQTGHDHHSMEGAAAPGSRISPSGPTQSGQAAFAAIQEIVEILEADPATNWSKVNIEALRQHLIDMDNVTLRADAKSEPVEGGIRFIVSGSGQVKESIQRMVTAHAAIMDGIGNWKFTATTTEVGANLTVVTPPKDAGKLRALGFIGVMARGMHHQEHHLMIARGDNPHH